MYLSQLKQKRGKNMLFKNLNGEIVEIVKFKSESGKFLNVFKYDDRGCLQYEDWFEDTKKNLRQLLKNLRELGFKRVK
jgi:hypothetical protein